MNMHDDRCNVTILSPTAIALQMGNTPLHRTSTGGLVAVVQLLLEQGADVDARDEVRREPRLGVGGRAVRRNGRLHAATVQMPMRYVHQWGSGAGLWMRQRA